MSIRRQEAKPRAFEAAGQAKATGDDTAYAMARAQLQVIRQKDAEARAASFLAAKDGTPGGTTVVTPASAAESPRSRSRSHSHSQSQKEADRMAKQAQYAQARAEIAARKARDAESRRAAYMAARGF